MLAHSVLLHSNSLTFSRYVNEVLASASTRFRSLALPALALGLVLPLLLCPDLYDVFTSNAPSRSSELPELTLGLVVLSCESPSFVRSNLHTYTPFTPSITT